MEPHELLLLNHEVEDEDFTEGRSILIPQVRPSVVINKESYTLAVDKNSLSKPGKSIQSPIPSTNLRLMTVQSQAI